MEPTLGELVDSSSDGVLQTDRTESISQFTSEISWEDETVDPIVLMILYQQITWILSVYVDSCVMIIGCIGNVIAFRILSPKAKLCSTFTYFSSLAVFNIAALLTNGIYFLLLVRFDIDLIIVLDCNAVLFSYFAFSQMSSLLLGITCVERACVVWFPFRAKTQMTVLKSRIVLACAFLVISGLNWQYLGGLQKSDDGGNENYEVKCQGKNQIIAVYNNVIYPWVDSVLYSLLPSVLILSMNVAAVVGLKRSRKAVQSANPAKTRFERRVTILTVILSSKYIMLTAPIIVCTLIDRNLPGDASNSTVAISLIARRICNTLSFCNHAFNLIVYLGFSEPLRKDLKTLVCLKK